MLKEELLVGILHRVDDDSLADNGLRNDSGDCPVCNEK